LIDLQLLAEAQDVAKSHMRHGKTHCSDFERAPQTSHEGLVRVENNQSVNANPSKPISKWRSPLFPLHILRQRSSKTLRNTLPSDLLTQEHETSKVNTEQRHHQQANTGPATSNCGRGIFSTIKAPKVWVC
jgi:hypothetical protein